MNLAISCAPLHWAIASRDGVLGELEGEIIALTDAIRAVEEEVP